MNIVARLVAAAMVAAAAAVALPGPAYAAPCSTDSGVTVVVDFNQLGGGVQQQCVSGGGGDAASSLFPAAGFTLKYAQRQPGFVCRVDDVPQSDPCVNTAPADAFWSLWWSDGDGSWTYASVGAASLNIPDGGFVAFSWDQVSGSEPPSAGATTPQAPQSTQPSPDQTGGGDGGATGSGSGNGGGQPAAPGGSSSPGTSPSDGPTTGTSPSDGDAPTDDQSGKPGKGKDRKKQPEASPGASPTDPTSSGPEEAADESAAVAEPASDSDGLPWWVAPVLIGVLFAAAGIVVLIRRRRAGA